MQYYQYDFITRAWGYPGEDADHDALYVGDVVYLTTGPTLRVLVKAGTSYQAAMRGLRKIVQLLETDDYHVGVFYPDGSV